MDWSHHFPKFYPPRTEGEEKMDVDNSPTTPRNRVEFADIGCGFGGLLTALAPMFPETLMLGKSQLGVQKQSPSYLYCRP